MFRNALPAAALSALVACAAAAHPTAAGAAAGPTYRSNLKACVMGARSCDRDMLRDDDLEYLRSDPSGRTRDPRTADGIVRARTSKPIRIVVTEERLDHLHRRDVQFERYRSTVRALRHGWIPGENAPYRQPPNAWAPSERRALERDVARDEWYGRPY